MHNYVIVGAGAAGCVLAARLSENSAVRVLLLEAGGDDDTLLVRAPGLYHFLWHTQRDWGFRTEPQPEVGGRRMFWPRGKMLGGSTSINTLIYIRGHRSSYDGWRDQGNPGWGYDDILPLFKRSENWGGPPSPFHGQEGPLHVRDLDTRSLACEAFVEAAVERCGVARNDDLNSPEPEGVGRYQLTIRNGRRVSAADAFLHPAHARPNLEVQTGAHALGLVVERGRVVGVRYRVGRQERTARAEQEVILAAGAIGSPHLLLLSGIGPAEQLRRLGVPVVLDLPGVGENLQDHLFMGVQWRARAGTAPHYTFPRSLAWLGRYVLRGTGPLDAPPVRTGGFVRTTPGLPRPDLQFHVSPWGGFTRNWDRRPQPETGAFLTIVPTLMYPKSRGVVRLASADPRVPPSIDPRYLSEREDLAQLITGVKLAREIASAKPLAAILGEEVAPGPAARSDEQVGASIRRLVNTCFHPVGTCRMGNDERAVVDPELRLRGLAGLRIADGSVMPEIIGGNTMAPIIMIGEKAADLIRSS